ncbi:MAG: 2,3,4,5-tetrahydropyridine-2,6-dicarboxylate N-succinyltransferase, partial [Pseudomonadota bacterium]
MQAIIDTIEAAWEARDTIDRTDAALRDAVDAAIGLLDRGEARVAEPVDGDWQVNEWLKKAVLLS